MRTGDQWDYLHEAAQLLRETGTMQGALAFSGPTAVCTQLLNWQPAMEAVWRRCGGFRRRCGYVPQSIEAGCPACG